MSDFSLRLPYLVYLSIGSLLVGVLVAPVFRDLPPPQTTSALEEESGQAAMTHMHTMRDIPASDAPTLTMTVDEDPMDGWNLTLEVENFHFDPQGAGGAHVPNAGHAHLYIGDTKVARLYGPHFHIPDLSPGQHEITVALSNNDHEYYAVDGDRVEARAVVMQAEARSVGH